ncbi:hypothetical protein [Halobellus limi]|uniref:Uncharacterized protein n=1 Tax=Halobellus limi TaxID=699433 RepID=A0A1H5VTD9_9EURY|nr:hypothetical protein [Halobellus limi]QCC46622.1 hypothetical protein DV707_02455 [Halobellus limi]SEF90585.1 hypothetical protein SAMN04488133_1065 [Halobellus limi]
MVTVIDFVVQLLTSVVSLVEIFLTDVLLGVDPITAISFLVGAGLTAAAVVALAYLALGALVNQLTGLGSSARESVPERTPR